jgi:hypothetical protein
MPNKKREAPKVRTHKEIMVLLSGLMAGISLAALKEQTAGEAIA